MWVEFAQDVVLFFKFLKLQVPCSLHTMSGREAKWRFGVFFADSGAPCAMGFFAILRGGGTPHTEPGQWFCVFPQKTPEYLAPVSTQPFSHFFCLPRMGSDASRLPLAYIGP